ncbi:synaptosomal-associated protein 29kDa [Arctopsyche grandis]|uniref:synaptosomal-associated protein 29kDa n=1 Tax=Arctopsyche grandis TaxID=121162 RepID=UPI00406DA2BF
MSGHHYIGGSGSLFDEPDVDDETFLRNARPRPSQGQGDRSLDSMAAIDAQRQTLLERRLEIEQRTLDSSSRSVGILRDSEKIGIATAEELMRQREQLENSSKRLDEINANLRFSQKHINGIKSVFSSLKNYISGKNESLPKIAPTPNEARPGESSLSEVLHNRPTRDLYDDHPSTRLRGLDSGNQRQGESSGSKKMNELLEANLDEMVSSISRLKGLATNLGEEIESQNDLIEDIHDKVEGADLTINRQNKQMNKILGK